MKKVIVGLSGGVDSSVSALLLKQQGYEVIGLFMKNWHDETVTISDDCPWLDDSNDAMLIAEKLEIPFQTVDLSEQYHSRIIDYMFNEYENGRTPNPDVLCNREIKFDIFLKIASNLGADYIATGHYCQVNKINKDKNKQKNQKSSNFGEAFKLSTELVAAVAVGTIIGFILDDWFGTKPWLILIFFFVGVIAGISNVIRSAKNMQK